MARQLCPNIIFVPPQYDKYLRFSQIAREIYGEYTDQVESFGLDECWLDVTGSTQLFGNGSDIANELRERMKFELGVSISVGVSYNKIFAKLGSDYKKPDATTEFTRENYRDIVWPLPAADLLYVGPATNKKLAKYGIHTIGDIANEKAEILSSLLGRAGLMLWSFANGMDSSPVTNAEYTPIIKSIGNSTTTPKDLTTDEDIKITLYILCESVAEHLREQNYQCRTVQISIRYDDLWGCERQTKLNIPASNSKAIFQAAYSLCQKNRIPNKAIRSLGVRGCDLSLNENIQLSLDREVQLSRRQDDLETTIDYLRGRFGHFSVQRGIALVDKNLSNLDPKHDHIIHPVGYL